MQPPPSSSTLCIAVVHVTHLTYTLVEFAESEKPIVGVLHGITYLLTAVNRIPQRRMWAFQPPTLLSLLLTILATTHTTQARPRIISAHLKELLESRYHYLAQRDCANPCGWAAPGSTAPLCCGSDQTCTANTLGQAVCGGGSAGSEVVVNLQGQGQQGAVYTTTIVEPGLITRTTVVTGSPQQTAASGSSCQSEMGEKPCGGICCATGQYCVYAGQCGASNGDGDASSSAILGEVFPPTATNSPPVRVTSNAATTVTLTGSATTTVPFSTPSSMTASATAAGGAAGASTTTNNGLSGGAIAGIVIGVLLGIALLCLLLFCCCAATAGNAVARFFGLGKRKKKTDVTYIEEHRHHHKSSGAAAAGGRTWYGARRPARVDKPKKQSSGVGGLTGVAAGLGALAVFLGLKRKHDKKKEEKKSDYAPSGYYGSEYSYYDSVSTRSDDRYTRRSGRSAPRR